MNVKRREKLKSVTISYINLRIEEITFLFKLTYNSIYECGYLMTMTDIIEIYTRVLNVGYIIYLYIYI